jgi:hypothetical protein
MATLPPNYNLAPVESLNELHMASSMSEEAVEHVLTQYRRIAGSDEELFLRMINAKTKDDSITGYVAASTL